MNRDLPGVALVITFFMTLFTFLSETVVSQILIDPLKNIILFLSIFISIALNVLRFRLQLQGYGTYQKKLDVKTFLFGSSNRGTQKMQQSEKLSKQTALTCPKTVTKI